MNNVTDMEALAFQEFVKCVGVVSMYHASWDSYGRRREEDLRERAQAERAKLDGGVLLGQFPAHLLDGFDWGLSTIHDFRVPCHVCKAKIATEDVGKTNYCSHYCQMKDSI